MIPAPLQVALASSIDRGLARASSAPPRHDARLATLVASGDAMRPTIDDGDTVEVDLADTRVHSGGGVYVIELDGRPAIRRLLLLADGEVELGCDSPSYRTRTAPRSSLKVLGRIVRRLAWREL